MRFLLAILLAMHQGPTIPHVTGAGRNAGGGNTFAIVQHTKADSVCANTNSCALTITSTGSGHYGVLIGSIFNSIGSNTYGFSSVTGGGGTWVACTGGGGGGCNANWNTGVGAIANVVAYNLTISSGVTSLTLNVTNSGSATGNDWSMEFVEFSWSGSTVAFDNASNAQSTGSGTSVTGVSPGTLLGSKDIIIQIALDVNTHPTSISGGAGYTAFTDFTTTFGGGYAGAINTTNTTAPTWTTTGSGDKVLVAAVAFSGS